MKTSELLKRLMKAGCRIEQHGGAHDKWYSPITEKHFFVPRHGSQEIATGTANRILKDAGLK